MFYGYSNEHSMGFLGRVWKVIFRPPKFTDFVLWQSRERRGEQEKKYRFEVDLY